MCVSDKERLRKARQHAAAARKEIKVMCQVMLPEACWQHAREAKSEAKAAVKAFHRAAKRQFRCMIPKRPSRQNNVEII